MFNEEYEYEDRSKIKALKSVITIAGAVFGFAVPDLVFEAVESVLTLTGAVDIFSRERNY